jgi:hypothetical protein
VNDRGRKDVGHDGTVVVVRESVAVRCLQFPLIQPKQCGYPAWLGQKRDQPAAKCARIDGSIRPCQRSAEVVPISKAACDRSGFLAAIKRKNDPAVVEQRFEILGEFLRPFERREHASVLHLGQVKARCSSHRPNEGNRSRELGDGVVVGPKVLCQGSGLADEGGMS